MRMVIHEMHEVIGLLVGDFPYEEFVPNKWELDELKQCIPLVLEVY